MKEEESKKIRLTQMLSSVPLFSGLEKKDLQMIASAGTEVIFDAGKTIIEQGEPGVAFLLILDGRVEVRKNGRPVAELGKGEFFGEITVIDDGPRSATVVALEETSCFGLTAWSFEGVVRLDPQIPIVIMRELARRLRQTEREVLG